MPSDSLNSIAELAKYGPTGVAIVALFVLLLVIRETLKFMAETRKEMRELAKATADTMKDVVDRNTDAHVKSAEATSALTASLPHVCKYNR